MNMARRDVVATALVGAGTLTYGLWLAGVLGGLDAPSIAVVVLALGFLASASAVVPGFAALLRGSRRYLAMTSLVGLVALAAGAMTVVRATQDTLAVLVVATIGLWLAATIRHATAHRPGAIATA